MTHRERADLYKARFLHEPDPAVRAVWRRLQMKHVVLASEEERASRGVTARDDTERAVWKPPCVRGCTVNCGRCAPSAGQKEAP